MEVQEAVLKRHRQHFDQQQQPDQAAQSSCKAASSINIRRAQAPGKCEEKKQSLASLRCQPGPECQNESPKHATACSPGQHSSRAQRKVHVPLQNKQPPEPERQTEQSDSIKAVLSGFPHVPCRVPSAQGPPSAPCINGEELASSRAQGSALIVCGQPDTPGNAQNCMALATDADDEPSQQQCLQQEQQQILPQQAQQPAQQSTQQQLALPQELHNSQHQTAHSQQQSAGSQQQHQHLSQQTVHGEQQIEAGQQQHARQQSAKQREACMHERVSPEEQGEADHQQPFRAPRPPSPVSLGAA